MHQWQDDRIFQRACIGLSRNGHQVHLVALGDSDELSVFQSEGVFVYLLPHYKGWKRRVIGTHNVIKKAIEIDANVYQFHDPDFLPQIITLKKKRPKAAIVYDIHENYAARFKDWGLPGFLGNWFRKYEKRMINKLNGISVVSQSMAFLFKNVTTPIEITRNSTDITRLNHLNLESVPKNSHPQCITSGSHSHERHCLQTVQALKFIAEANIKMPEFMFAGRYLKGIKEEMKAQAEKDATLNYLKLEGMLPWEDNFKRIAAAFCGFVFYKKNDNNSVGIPNRLFEYMYCGIPVIVSDFPELRQVVESAKCGLVVNSESPAEIAEAVIKLLKNTARAEKMGKNGRVALEETYGYHIDLERLESFYINLLSATQ